MSTATRKSGMVKNCAVQYLVCSSCAKEPHAQQVLIEEGLMVDLFSLDGRKKLLRNAPKKKRKRKQQQQQQEEVEEEEEIAEVEPGSTISYL